MVTHAPNHVGDLPLDCQDPQNWTTLGPLGANSRGLSGFLPCP